MSAPYERSPRLLVAGAVAAVALLTLPLLSLIGRVDWSSWLADVTSPEALDALRLSLVTTAVATVLAVVLGLPLAWLLATHRFRGRALLRGVVLLPMVLPPVVAGVALFAAFGRDGVLGAPLDDLLDVRLTFTPAAVVLAQTFVALPFFVITAEAGLTAHGERFDDAARSLGARPWHRLRHVTLPLAGPSIAAGATLAAARALGEFGATITFAGNVGDRTRTLPLAVYTALDQRPAAAVALSSLLLVIALVTLVAMRSRWTGALR